MTAAATGHLPPATVVLATKDRPADLRRAIGSIQALDYPALSILVIDQSETSVVSQAELSGRHPVRLLLQPGKGKSRALNLALHETADEMLLFTDDDCLVPSDWAHKMVALLLEDEALGLAFSRVEPVEHDPRAVFIPDFLPARPRRFTRPWMGRRFGGLGASMAARRSVLIAAGGFDERLGPGSHYGNSEDTDIAYRVLRLGRHVLHSPETAVAHAGGRAYRTGAAREIVVRSYYSFGAMCGRSIRSGDGWALVPFAFDLAEMAGIVAWNGLRLHRPLGLRRPLALVRGFRAGLRDGSPRQDASTRVRQAAGAERPAPALNS